METTPVLLSGRRGWTVVTVLALALLLLVGGQLAPASARAGGLSAPTTSTELTAGPAQRLVAALIGTDRPVPGRPATPAPPAAPAAPAAPAGPATPPSPAAPAVPPTAPAPQAPAPATATSDCSGDGWQQRRGATALTSLAAGAERTGFTVEFGPARSGYLGLTHLQQQQVEVFVRDCDTQSDALLRHVVAHELGHAYDTTHLDAVTRAAWQQARGIATSTPWYGCSGCTDFATPAGDFAEVYAQWARGASDNRSELAGSPGPAQLAELARQFFGA